MTFGGEAEYQCYAKFDLATVQSIENDHLQRRRPMRQLFLNSLVLSPVHCRTSLRFSFVIVLFRMTREYSDVGE